MKKSIAAIGIICTICLTGTGILAQTADTETAKEITKKTVQIKVFPNPAVNELQIEGAFETETFFRICNNTGKGIQHFEIKGNLTKIDLTTFSKGIYFYDILNYQGELLKSGRLVVEK